MSETNLRTKSYAVKIEKSASPDYDARFVMSATGVDRDGDTIADKALKTVADTTSKLIALWQHDSNRPVGYWENLQFRGGLLKGYIKFASTSLARLAKTLIDDDVPLSASIGFSVKDAEPNKSGGVHFKEIEMLECSIVSVPAQPLAVQVAKSLDFTDEQITKIFDSSKAVDDPVGDSAEKSVASDDAWIETAKKHPSVIKANQAILAVNRLMRKSK